MLSATYGRSQLVRCMFLAARCLLHVVSMHRCSSSRPFCLVRVMHSMIPAARCLQHVVCHTLSAARCPLHVVCCASMLHVVRCMLYAAWCLLHAFGRLTSPASFPLHVVRCTLSSLVCLRCVLSAGCFVLDVVRCMMPVARCLLQLAACVECSFAVAPIAAEHCAAPCAAEWDRAGRVAPYHRLGKPLRCASHAVRNRTTPRSTVAVLSVAIVAWQAATAGGVSRTAHVPSRTFKPTALSHVPCCRCARLHFACRRQTLETPSPRFREGSRHTTATSTATLPAHSLCSPHVPMPPHFQC